jgi:hypothetical protein
MSSLLAALATLTVVAADDPEVFRVHDTYFVREYSPDPGVLRPDVADRVSLHLGMTRLSARPGSRCYRHRPGIDAHQYCFEFGREGGRYLYGVSTSPHVNVARFLVGAYRQEIDPGYRDDPSNFVALPRKTNREFWRRTFINMGYGAQYVYQDNPFTDRVWVAVGFGYLWESLHYVPIFAGPFLGKTPKDKVLIPVIGLGSLLFWKVAFNGLLIRSHLVEYNTIADSGYRAPRAIWSTD